VGDAYVAWPFAAPRGRLGQARSLLDEVYLGDSAAEPDQSPVWLHADGTSQGAAISGSTVYRRSRLVRLRNIVGYGVRSRKFMVPPKGRRMGPGTLSCSLRAEEVTEASDDWLACD